MTVENAKKMAQMRLRGPKNGYKLPKMTKINVSVQDLLMMAKDDSETVKTTKNGQNGQNWPI